MRKFLILFLVLSLDAVASEYIVEKPDGSIVIVHHNDAAIQTIEETLQENGLSGLPVTRIKQSDIPYDPAERVDRNHWKRGFSKKIEVDSAKRQAAADAKAAKEAEKDAILEKLKISREEFEKIKQ